jgi:3-oxoacyl-[acyl-carrier protein] reductase
MDLGLQDKVAIVMAATKGLGRACATALAAEGTRVTIGARDVQVLEKTAQEIQQATMSRVLAVPTDVTRAEDVEAIVAATVREFGRIDILVNNAGGPLAGKFASFGDADWQAAFELNLLSTVRLVRLVSPHMHIGQRTHYHNRQHIGEAANRRTAPLQCHPFRRGGPGKDVIG